MIHVPADNEEDKHEFISCYVGTKLSICWYKKKSDKRHSSIIWPAKYINWLLQNKPLISRTEKYKVLLVIGNRKLNQNLIDLYTVFFFTFFCSFSNFRQGCINFSICHVGSWDWSSSEIHRFKFEATPLTSRGNLACCIWLTSFPFIQLVFGTNIQLLKSFRSGWEKSLWQKTTERAIQWPASLGDWSQMCSAAQWS